MGLLLQIIGIIVSIIALITGIKAIIAGTSATLTVALAIIGSFLIKKGRNRD